MELDPGSPVALLNDAVVAAEVDRMTLRNGDRSAPLELAPAPVPSVPSDIDIRHSSPAARYPVKVAILSFLFNWPSTGGGNHHTVGAGRSSWPRAGYEVRISLPGSRAGGSGGSAMR